VRYWTVTPVRDNFGALGANMNRLPLCGHGLFERTEKVPAPKAFEDIEVNGKRECYRCGPLVGVFVALKLARSFIKGDEGF